MAVGAFPTISHAQSTVVETPYTMLFSRACQFELMPDRAVIAGAVAVQGLKPLDVSDKLDQTIDAIESYAAENGYEITTSAVRRHGRNLANPRAALFDNPIIFGKTVRVVMPVDADVDAALQKLIELGMNQFGINWEIETFPNDKVENAVHFIVNDTETRLNEAVTSCREDSIKHWCAAQSLQRQRMFCARPISLDRIEIDELTFHLDDMLLGHGRRGKIAIRYPFNQDDLEQLRVIENRPISFDGTIRTRLMETQ